MPPETAWLVAVIGIGEDGWPGLSADACAAISAAQVLAGGERHHALVPQFAGERVVFRRDAASLAATLAERAAQGQRVAVLASGDPLFFGIGAALAERLGSASLRVYPTVSSVQWAFARLAEPWQDARVLSVHGRPLAPAIAAAVPHARLAFLTDDDNTPAAVAYALLRAGVEADARAWVMQRLGGPDELIQPGTLAEMVGVQADPLSLLVILRDPARVRGPLPRIGLPDEAFAHLAGQITKAEVRAVALARLAPRAGDTVWDVGAGSGSVSVEAGWLAHPGSVYAIEARTEQMTCLETNLSRFSVFNVTPVLGRAPGALASLPRPDRIFVGGNGGDMAAVLGTCVAALSAGGRLVANVVTLAGLHQAAASLSAAGSVDVTQVSIARAAPIAGDLRLAALNPVFIVSLERAA